MTEVAQINAENVGRTGFFRDSIRRIDMVLVVKDDGDDKTEQIKAEYLTNATKFGLSLELEPGVMPFHKSLIFIKVHAPESIVEEYGNKFEIYRHFKQSHVEFINPKGLVLRFLSLLGFSGSHEKEWIKLVRKQYPNPKRYSTLERSMIVYKLLLMLPFGEYENYVGFNRLFQSGIILDAFPLHDGPYFSVPKQKPSQYNARQILNYNWIGLGNILKSQPLNLIHEYFGDRVAFFFAFYGFYTFSLIFPAVITTATIVPEILNKTVDRTYDVHYNHPTPVKAICPRCRNFKACPFLPFHYYNKAIEYNNIFDKGQIDKLVVYIVIWATFFLLFWRRKEYYWMWMWECNPELLDNSVRAEYVPNKDELQENSKKNILGSVKSIITALVTMGAFLMAWAGLALCLLLLQDFVLGIFVPKFGYDLGHYKALIIFYAINVTIMIIFEKLWTYVSYTLNNLQNHKTESDYESSLVLKLFGFTFPFTCTLFVYIAFVKGRIFTYPADPEMFKFNGIAMNQCNPVGCSDELALSLLVTVILKECIFKLLSDIQGLFFLTTDYNQGKSVNVKVPCWEREYTLTPVKEDFVNDKFKSLAIQFTLTIVFVHGCPMTLFFVIIVNVLDIRSTARRLVKGCRRPLLQKNLGLGSWKTVFMILIFATLFVNLLIVVATTSRNRFTNIYLVYTRRKPKFLIHRINKYPQNIQNEIKHLARQGVKFLNGTECHYEGAAYIQPTPDERIRPLKIGIWYRIRVSLVHFTRVAALTTLCIVLLFAIIPPNQRDIERTKAIEKSIFDRK